MDADTLFEIGSIAKTLIGVLLADAVRRREIGLDDPIERHLPAGFTVHKKLRGATVAHLATLTTGFPWFPDNWVGVDPHTRRTRYTLAQFREWLAKFDPSTRPGEKHVYTATDTALLAIILSERTRTPFARLLRARIFEPLGMTRSTYADQFAVDGNRLDGYGEDGFVVPDRMDVSPMGPCCAVRSTLADMARYMKAALGASRTLSPAFEVSMAPRFPIDADGSRSIGLGWFVDHRSGVVSKNGLVSGYRTALVLYPHIQSGVFVVVNSALADADAIADRISRELFRPFPIGVGNHEAFVVEALPEGVTRASASFSESIRLEGWSAPTCVRPGETAVVIFYYRCLRELERDFRIFLHADSSDGKAKRINQDHYPGAGKDSTLAWKTGELVRDEFTVAVPGDYGARRVTLWTGWYKGGDRLEAASDVLDVADNRVRGPTISVGECAP